jgi:ABC-type transport system involved in cytochrome bd biosynthesis fused ATPase/permease subunit
MLSMSIQKFEHQAMSTVFELLLATDEQQLAQSAAHKVFEAIDKIEVMFSRFLDASEVALIRRERSRPPSSD